MADPDAQCDALAARVQKELRGLLADDPEVGWDRGEGGPRRGLARFFTLEYAVSHRLFAAMELIDGQKAELHLYVDGEHELPAGLELFATLGWSPSAPAGMVRGVGRFEGDPGDVEPLNHDDKLLALVREVLRTEWSRGDVIVERPDALLEVVPEPAIVHASTLPRDAWLGLAQDFALSPFIDAADRIEEFHRQGDD
jgi:hypothetical protein